MVIVSPIMQVLVPLYTQPPEVPLPVVLTPPLDPLPLEPLVAGPPIDVTWSLRQGGWPGSSALRTIDEDGRLWVMAPRKWLPRRIWSNGDHSLVRQVLAAAQELRLNRPLLWINDSTYAPLLKMTSWPSVSRAAFPTFLRASR